MKPTDAPAQPTAGHAAGEPSPEAMGWYMDCQCGAGFGGHPTRASVIKAHKAHVAKAALAAAEGRGV